MDKNKSMKNQNTFVHNLDDKLESGETITLTDLIEFATAIDNQAVNLEYMKELVEKGDFRHLSPKQVEKQKEKIHVELPSASVIRLNNLPSTMYEFKADQQRVFIEKLNDIREILGKKVSNLREKINMERSEIGII